MNEARIYQAFYTKSDPIISYMINLLNLKGDEDILEPCAGDGVFIDPILETFPDIKIDALELNQEAIVNLKIKYSSYENVDVRQTDTLTDIDLDLLSSMGGKYDAIIANPPYGAWRNQEERDKLKKRYKGFYAKESYSLFLLRAINLLKDGGKLVFIIPDTYLNLNMHKQLRKLILTQTQIKEISLFPSSYFPGVNFGYANLSIISLQKSADSKANQSNKFNILKDYNSVEELPIKNNPNITSLNRKQSDIISNAGSIFLTNQNPLVSKAIKNAKYRIGDICKCATGFYSGNDKDRLKVSK